MARIRERENIRALVSAYLDGELSPEEALYVQRMIHEDSRFARAYETYAGIRTTVRTLPRLDAPPAVSSGVRAYTAANPTVRPVLTLRARAVRAAGAFAALAATLITIFTGAFGLTPRPTFGYSAANATVVGAPTTISVRPTETYATLLNGNLNYDEQAEIRFSGAIDDATVRDGVAFSPGIPRQNLRYDPNTLILSTVPNTLRPGTNYRVDIRKGLLDRQGAEVRSDSFALSVGPAPVVVPPPVTPTVAPAETVVAAVVPTERPEATATVAAVAVMRPTATAGASRPVATATLAPVAVPVATPDDNSDPTATAPRVVAPVATVVPATVASRPSTATTAAVRATATTPAAAATATPAPRPTNTAAPTTAPTATPVPTPAATATPVAPAIPVSARFSGAYAQTANRLGEPVSAATAASGTTLKFEKGLMIYVQGRGDFLVIYPNGAYGTVANPGGSGRAMAAPSGGFTPGGPYGAAWTANNLQGRLGYATTQSEGAFSGTVQTFDNGFILAVGGDVYVFTGGTYQLFG